MENLKLQSGYKVPVYGGGTFMRPSGTTSNDPALKVAQQKMQILEQDVLLDEIGSGVDRLHGRALMINEETTLQTVGNLQSVVPPNCNCTSIYL